MRAGLLESASMTSELFELDFHTFIIRYAQRQHDLDFCRGKTTNPEPASGTGSEQPPVSRDIARPDTTMPLHTAPGRTVPGRKSGLGVDSGDGMHI